MAFVIPYKSCKIHLSNSSWEGGKEFATYEVKGTTPLAKEVLVMLRSTVNLPIKPIKGKVAAPKALEIAKHKIDDLFGKSHKPV